MDIIPSIGIGALAGAIYGVIGYVKNKKENGKVKFELAKIAPVLVLSAVCGGVLGLQGLEFGEILTGAGFAGILLNKVISMISE